MKRFFCTLAAAGVLAVLLPQTALGVARDLAGLQPARLTFDRSVINQLSNGTYRDPFDELQTRPYNLIFANIGRHSTLTPWEGQEGNYTRYVNALIGNNGAVNVDNDADSIQGSLIRRETDSIAWGISAAYIAGTTTTTNSNATEIFRISDELEGVNLRPGLSWKISDRRVLGGGISLTQAATEFNDDSFEAGVGGTQFSDQFEETNVWFDAGLRTFLTPRSSWEVQVLAGVANYEQDEFTEQLDAAGMVVAVIVARDYDISEMGYGIYGSYNRLALEGLGETEYRVGVERSSREFDNQMLSFVSAGGVITPGNTLVGQDPNETTRLHASARKVFQAGETEMFVGGQIGYAMVEGATQIDDTVTTVSERIEDNHLFANLTIGLRQAFLRDKLRFIVTGRGDILSTETSTIFNTASTAEDIHLTNASYAIGLEGVLSNVVLDLAWFSGVEEPVVPVDLGLPGGSRRSVKLDRLTFSAGIAW